MDVIELEVEVIVVEADAFEPIDNDDLGPCWLD